MKRILSILISSFLLSTAVNAQLSGTALHFDGVDDYVLCPLPSIFTNIGTNDFTVELWASPDVGSFERLFFAEFDDNNFASISLNSSGGVVFYLYENGLNHSVSSSDSLNPLEWAHIAVTWNAASQEAKIFVNGDETSYGGALYISSTGTDGKMTFGSKTDGTQNFKGMMDELTIWSVAKPECEISFEMNDKKIGSEPNIIGAYIFDLGIPGGANPNELISTDLGLPYEDGNLMNFALNGSTSNWILSYANIIRLWGAESQAFLGQLGLISTINADYFQWIYCDDNLPVPGATDVTFDPASQDPNYTGINDSYAVISTTGNCADTSECFVVNSNVGVNENDLDSYISIFPNPSQGVVSIESSITIDLIEILSVSGEIAQIIHPNSTGKLQFELAQENGFYLIVLHTSVGLLTKKILVHNN